MNQRGYINIDIAGMVWAVVLITGIVVGSVAMAIGLFLPDIWAWVKAALHGWTAP